MASRLRTPSKFEIREPKETIDRLARAKQLVVGMSGGLDSSVTAALCAIAVGGSKVLGLSMPENETFKPGNIEDGRKVARKFRVRFEVIDMTPFQDVARTMLDPDPSNRRIAWGNIKARLRATILYYKANVSDGLVIGTGDKSEVMRSKTLPSTSIFPVAFTQRRLAQSCGPDKLPRRNLDLAMIQSTRFSGDLRDGSVPKR